MLSKLSARVLRHAIQINGMSTISVALLEQCPKCARDRKKKRLRTEYRSSNRPDVQLQRTRSTRTIWEKTRCYFNRRTSQTSPSGGDDPPAYVPGGNRVIRRKRRSVATLIASLSHAPQIMPHCCKRARHRDATSG